MPVPMLQANQLGVLCWSRSPSQLEVWDGESEAMFTSA